MGLCIYAKWLLQVIFYFGTSFILVYMYLYAVGILIKREVTNYKKGGNHISGREPDSGSFSGRVAGKY